MFSDKLNKLYSRILVAGKSGSGLSADERYNLLRRNLVITMALLVIIPLSLIAIISSYRYSSLLHEEVQIGAQWSTEIARQSIETYLDKLRSSVQLVSDSYNYSHLSSQENLDAIFRRLKSKHPGLVDISIISPGGIQVAYSGPYELSGKGYKDSAWYTRALTKDSYISEVFMGYRDVPHFVVAVSKKMGGGGGNWLIRASVDTETLDRFLEPIRSDFVTDAFLVDREGVLQNDSKHNGSVSNKFTLPDVTLSKRISIEEAVVGGKDVLLTLVEIKDTPWILVLQSKSFTSRKTWRSFKNQMLLIFLTCALLTVTITIKIAHYVADNIREAEKIRSFMLAETEHTSKLASIGRLAAGVAHEINNPLAIINEKAGLMKDLLKISEDFKQKEKFLAQLDSLQNAVNRSHTITHRLLGFARRMEVKREPVNVNDVIGDVMSFLEKEALHNNVRIVKNLDTRLPMVTGDRGQMQQIFLNVVNNAIDAVGKGGMVHITSMSASPDAIEVDIHDNGPGIPPEVRKHIFEPFFTTKTGSESSGTGLGLSITYGLVKKMGGQIHVESTPESGTTFRIVLPLDTLAKE